ncbi:MAG: A/G-specific adenine glycosylase [Opitutaceae bacterium]|nr:A/G-specific adenine glycosylase [Opitutaceae bacterium]
MPSLAEARPAFQKALHAWYRVHHRRLPWRKSPSLYQTVVSEFMLQQTQVATVQPYFARWLRELPDFAALAAAPEAKVLKLWEGLGYYSRARNLHRLAKAFALLPAPPTRPEVWRELPGIGPYTAAAITSIAFGQPEACVDGNVVRILARLTGTKRLFRHSTEAARYFAPRAAALIEGADPGLHNQAMMELGATVCLRQKPRCLICPVARFCTARTTPHPGKFPRLMSKQVEKKLVNRVWCEHRGRLLLRRAHAKAQRLAGLHELPEAGDLGMAAHPTDVPVLVARKRRTITRFRITEAIYRYTPSPNLLACARRNSALEWVRIADLDRLALSGPHRRWVRELLAL